MAHACVLDGLRPQTGTHGRKSKKLCFRLRRRNQDDLLCINLTSIIRASSMTWHHSPGMTIINGEILWRRRCNGTGKLAGVQLEFRPGRKRHNLFSVTPKPNYYCVATFLPKLDLELHRAISSTTRTAFYYLWRTQTLSSSSTQPPTIPSGDLLRAQFRVKTLVPLSCGCWGCALQHRCSPLFGAHIDPSHRERAKH